MPTLCRPIPLLLLLLVCGCAHTGAPPLGVPLTPNLEFIETWSLCGPFPPGGSPELEKSWNRADLDSEEACEMIRQQRFRALTGEAGWRERGIESFQSLSRDTFTKEMRSLPARGLNLLNAFPSRNTQCSAYALTLIQSDRPRTWDLFVGSDDGVTIWLNSREILRSTRSRPLVPNEDVVAASFRKGRNTLLVKSTNIMGYWAFTFRLYSPDSSVPTPLPEEGASFIP